MKTFTVLTLGAALYTLPAFSQTGAAAPGLSAFARQGDMTFDVFGGVNSSAVGRDFVRTTSGSVGVQAGWGIGHKLILTGTFAYDDIGRLGANNNSVNAKEFEIGLLRAFRQKGHIEPYGSLDVGGIHQGWRDENGVLATGGTQAAVAPGLGFLLAINRYFAFDFGVRAVVPAASNPLPWQIQGIIGFVFRKPASGR